MKQLLVATLLLSATLWAQSGPASDAPDTSWPVHGTSYSQTYCSGFITRDAISRSSFVLGSKESPHEDRYQGRSLLFLRGPNLAQGQRYSLLRQVADPNHEDSSPEQRRKLESLGGLYEDVGWVTVRSVENGTAVASFDFSCGAATPGDLVVPFQERPAIAFRTTEPELATFRTGSAKLTGHIVGSRDFDSLFGNGQIVYTDFGTIKGAKPGEYLVVSRGYALGDLNKIDRASESLPIGAEPTAVNPAIRPPDAGRSMPVHILGELLVLNVSSESSTALITRTSAEMELGDVVQKEEAQDEDSERQDAQGNVARSQTTTPAADDTACRPASRARRMLLLSRGCKAPKDKEVAAAR